MAEGEKVLVYHFRHSGTPIVPKGLGTLRRTELDRILQKNPHLRAARKSLRRNTLAVDIYRRDLEAGTAMSPAAGVLLDANVAGLRIPWDVWVQRLLTGAYKELWIVSANEPSGHAPRGVPNHSQSL